jgi:DNA end-binding protein Ku
VPDDDLDLEGVSTRPFWSGTITFGLVSIPVNLLPATRSRRVSLRMVSLEGRPLSRRYVAPRDGRLLDWDEIVRGYEVEKDRFVVVDDEELERLAPEKTRDIDLRSFVDLSAIDPMHFERPYFLTPAGGSTKAYRLLARVMEETQRAGIATFVMRAKEYLIAILAENGVLRAETLRFADEVRSPETVGLPEPVKAPAAEVGRVEKAIAKLEKKSLDVSEVEDTSSRKLIEIALAKAEQGRDVFRGPDEQEEEPRDVIDLVEMLQRSLQGKSTSGAKSDSADDAELGERSKAELYEMAKELDIPGRAGMNKEELIDAIARSA